MPYRKSTKPTKKTSYTNTGDSSRTEKIPQKKFEGILRFTEKRTTVETHDGEIFFIFGQKNRGYVHGDLVRITPTRKGNDGKLPEARIDRLIRRSRESLLIEMRFFKGRYCSKKWGSFSGKIQNRKYSRDYIPLWKSRKQRYRGNNHPLSKWCSCTLARTLYKHKNPKKT